MGQPVHKIHVKVDPNSVRHTVHNVCSLACLCLMDNRGMRVTKNAYFSLSTYTKELLLVTFCDSSMHNCRNWKCDGTDRQTWHDRMWWDAKRIDRFEGWNIYVDVTHMSNFVFRAMATQIENAKICLIKFAMACAKFRVCIILRWQMKINY